MHYQVKLISLEMDYIVFKSGVLLAKFGHTLLFSLSARGWSGGAVVLGKTSSAGAS